MDDTPDEPAHPRPATGEASSPAAPAASGPLTAHPAAPATTGVRKALVTMLVVIAAVVVAADQATKQWALTSLPPDGTPRTVLDGWLQFRLVFNPGAAFSLATGTTWIFTVIATVVAVVILRVSRRLGSAWWAAALGLLLGGAVGNLVDRLTRQPGFARGHVIDFVEYLRFPFIDFPVFNVADSCITVAAVLVALLGFRGIALDGSHVGHRHDDRPAAPADHGVRDGDDRAGRGDA